MDERNQQILDIEKNIIDKKRELYKIIDKKMNIEGNIHTLNFYSRSKEFKDYIKSINNAIEVYNSSIDNINFNRVATLSMTGLTFLILLAFNKISNYEDFKTIIIGDTALNVAMYIYYLFITKKDRKVLKANDIEELEKSLSFYQSKLDSILDKEKEKKDLLEKEKSILGYKQNLLFLELKTLISKKNYLTSTTLVDFNDANIINNLEIDWGDEKNNYQSLKIINFDSRDLPYMKVKTIGTMPNKK